ncbi:serine/threonine-protein kinase [Nocardia sp. NPDC051030]|uniref:serine/threonine-protein kinase n=1 Tax=Nocardia sp. NPDC051030 TaxID=3155162 RepID=UPI00341C1178
MRRSSGEPQPGEIFAGYLIERVLGSGGMGTVYVVHHPRLPRRDALKVLSAECSTSEEFRARFIREADLAARLDHPNLVTVHDRGIAQERLWISMQFVDGTDAAELLRQGWLPPERVAHIVREAAQGLDAVHRAGLLHRDVKPANILIDSRPGRPDRVLVSDFGIAKAATGSTMLTEAGAVLATLAYVAPEQLELGPVDRRADIYALGCTLYELLTGSQPFPRPNPGAVMSAHLHDPPPRPTAANPALPHAIDDVVAKAMAKNPGHRYESCGELAIAATAALGLSASLVPADTVRIETHHRKRRMPAIGLLLAVILIAAAGLIGWNLRPTDHPAAPTGSSPTTTAAVAKSWGNYADIVQAFPNLLPANPDASGYQGIRCIPMDEERRPVDVNASVSAKKVLNCNGSRNPLELLVLKCYTDGRAVDGKPIEKDAAVTGEEQWERPTGGGHLSWGDITGANGRTLGALGTTFTAPARQNCELYAYGGTSGQNLHDTWWSTAPI